MNPTLQAFASSMLQTVYPSNVYIGFPNGDFLGFEYTCKRHGCTDPSSIVGSLRITNISGGTVQETSNCLLRYNTTQDSRGNVVIDYSAMTQNEGYYDAVVRPWYQAGIACGRRNGTRAGMTCLSSVYLSVDGVSLTMTFVQPYFKDDSTGAEPVAVMAVDVFFQDQSGGAIGTFIQAIMPADSEWTVVQDAGA